MIWISQASTKGIAALDYYLVNILVPTSGNNKSLRIPTKLHWCLQSWNYKLVLFFLLGIWNYKLVKKNYTSTSIKGVKNVHNWKFVVKKKKKWTPLCSIARSVVSVISWMGGKDSVQHCAVNDQNLYSWSISTLPGLATLINISQPIIYVLREQRSSIFTFSGCVMGCNLIS